MSDLLGGRICFNFLQYGVTLSPQYEEASIL